MKRDYVLKMLESLFELKNVKSVTIKKTRIKIILQIVLILVLNSGSLS